MSNQKGKGQPKGDGREVISEPRFAKLHTDRRFATIRKKDKAVHLDSRFKQVVQDRKFAIAGQKDSRGRDNDVLTKAKARRQTKELREQFHIDSEDRTSQSSVSESESMGSDHAAMPKTQPAQPSNKGKDKLHEPHPSTKFMVEDEDQSGEDELNMNDEEQDNYWARKARGELESSSGEDFSKDSDAHENDESLSADEFSSDSDDELGSMDEEAYNEGVLNQELAYGEETHRIAIINCDWERLKAVDIMVACSSFCPSTGLVKSVHIYPSDFGLSMMAEEDLNGPAIYQEPSSSKKADFDEEAEEERSGTKENGYTNTNSEKNFHHERSDGKTRNGYSHPKHDYKSRNGKDNHHQPSDISGDENTSEGKMSALDQIKLRRYELNKLRYYFAVVTCDSIGSASAIYGSLDNQEIEFTSNKLDMRFVPDDISFEDRPLKDVCTQVPANYEPPSFYTTVLQKTEAKLTWDQTPKDRLAITQAAFSHLAEIDESKYAQLIASSESESDEPEATVTRENVPVPLPKMDEKDRAFIKEKQRKKYASLLLGLDNLEDEEEEGRANDEDDFFRQTEAPVGEMTFSLSDSSKTTKGGAKLPDVDEEIKRKVQEKLSKKPSRTFKLNTTRSVTPKYRPDEKDLQEEEGEGEDGQDTQLDGMVDKTRRRRKTRTYSAASSENDNDGDDESMPELLPYQEKSTKDGRNSNVKARGSQEKGEEEDIWEGFEEGFERPSKSKLAKLKKRKREEREKAMKGDVQGRAELKLLLSKDGDGEDVEDDDNASDSDGRPRKRRNRKGLKQKKEPETEIDLSDSRFKVLMKDPRFMPDPTNPNFKKTASVKAILDARKDYRKKYQTRGGDDDSEDVDDIDQPSSTKLAHPTTSSTTMDVDNERGELSSASRQVSSAMPKKHVQRGFYDMGNQEESKSEGLSFLIQSVKSKAKAAAVGQRVARS